MNVTIEPIKLAAMSRYELVKLIRKQGQQVNTLTKNANDFEEMYKQEHRGKNKLNRQVTTLTEALETASNFVDAMMSFYGQNLQVYGWHLNGDAEPFDNFIDDNVSCDELDKIRLTLQSLESPREEQTPKIVRARVIRRGYVPHKFNLDDGEEQGK